jgi:OmpA-OmpF porin, OOP family
MKKITLIVTLLTAFASSYAQKDSEGITNTEHNKWTVEFNVGQTKGVRPYQDGYYSSKPNGLFGQVEANSFNLSVRNMFSKYLGYKLSLGFDKIGPNGNNESLPFEMRQITFGTQLYVNAIRLFNAQEQLGRWGLLFHGGIQVSRMTSYTENTPIPGEPVSHNQNYGVSEYNGGLMLGITPQFRISKRLALMLDITNVNNYRQHFNWDGSYSTTANNLAGQQITTSLGLSYSFGDEDMHGDWADYAKDKEVSLDNVNKRIDKIEELMNDTDKDGVPDIYDQENNSVAGVAVDTRGKMVDINRDGVPDELEKRLDEKYTTRDDSKGMVEKFINDGYVAAYFETNKSQPTNESTEGIDFILTFLRSNPNSTLDIYGHADEIGKTAANNVLSDKRANAVKEILTKAGISANRINVIASGEDSSVDVTSEGARSLVRRVTFKVK